MKINTCIPLLVSLVISGSSMYGQLQNIKIPFEALTTKEGLVSNRVTSIIKDSLGFYWYGTSLGLNRHDGHHLETFRHDRQNPYTIPHDDIKNLINVTGMVIAGVTTKGQIFVYDYRDKGYNRIFRVPLWIETDSLFDAETITSDGRFIYAVNGTGDIYQIDPDELTGHHFESPAKGIIDRSNTSLFHAGVLWIGAENGFFSMNPTTCEIRKIDLSFYSPNASNDLSVRVIEPYDASHFFLGSIRSAKFPFKGIIKYNFKDGTHDPLCLFAMEKNFDDYPIDIIKTIRPPVVFIRVTNLSRFVYNLDTHEWDSLTIRPNHTRYLHTSSLNCAAAEPNGRFRIGSNQGVFIYHPESTMFEEFYPDTKFKQKQWTGLYKNDSELLYIGTPTTIRTYEPRSDQVLHTARFPYIQSHHRLNQQPQFIDLDAQRFLVLSSRLYMYDVEVNQLTLIEQDTSTNQPVALKSNHFPYVLTDTSCFFVRDGRLLNLNLHSLCLDTIDVYDGNQQKVFLDASGIAIDRDGYLWISTYNFGLVRVHPASPGFVNHTAPVTGCRLNDIHIDALNDLWLSTTSCGLMKVDITDPKHPRFIAYGKKEGFITDDLNQIMEDDYNRIWTTSRYGINCFDKSNETVLNFGKSHGIEFPHNIHRGKTKDKEGHFYVSGGVNIIRINPHSFTKTEKPPPVYIKQFRINHQPVSAFWRDTSITLKHRQNNFTFEISAINHIHPALTRYKYKLENFHSDWITTSNDQLLIPFNNLEPGSYVFRAIAANYEGSWNAQGININLKILPPLIKTWWFKAIMACIVIGIIYLIFRQRTQRLLALQRVEIEKNMALENERNRISRDMHDDLGSGLSAIHLLSNYIKQNAEEKYPEFSSDIDKIRRSSEDLNERIREIIWTVNTKDDTLQSLILFIRRYCHDWQENSRVPIQVEADNPSTPVFLSNLQRKNIYLSVKEAINNALKHGNPTNIHVSIVAENNNHLTIHIKDNGSGFDVPGVMQGNGISNMADRMFEIGGLARIESQPGSTDVILSMRIA